VKKQEGHICPIYVAVELLIIQNAEVKENYLFELERNLELQASGFLMQKDSHLLQSQIRTEQFQIGLFDRVRAQVNQEISVQISDGTKISGKVLEVASDHLCLQVGMREFAIPIWAVTYVNRLTNKTRQASILQSKWTLSSYLRSSLIEKNQLSINLGKSITLNGKVVGVFQDNFDIQNDESKYSIPISRIMFSTKDVDIDD
jgi:molybdopterin-binding protein